MSVAGTVAGQMTYISVLPPARNTVIIKREKETSQIECAVLCSNDACSYFEYTPETEECITKKNQDY